MWLTIILPEGIPMAELDNPGAGQETTGRTVVGMFRSRSGAEAAIRDLKSSGFTDEQIGVAMQDQSEQRDLLESSGGQAAEGAATGAVSGGVVGGIIGLLGSILVPGLGPIVVGGVLASTLTGAGIGAATGGLIGALIGLGVPEADAQHFDLGLRSGGTLVTVSAGPRVGEALAILERHGTDLGPSGRTRYDRAAASGTADTAGLAGSTYGDVGSRIGVADVAFGSSTGDRGMSSARRYQGSERRLRLDPAYAGPERRMAGV